MASADFESFYNTFLPQFLQNSVGLDDNQKAILATNFSMEEKVGALHSNLFLNLRQLSL